MGDIEWQEPPPRENGEPPYEEVRSELRSNPGRWALIRSYASKQSANSARTQWMAKGFEAVTRGCDLYARWPEAD